MKYIEVSFTIDCQKDIFDISSELLADMAGECGFEAFVDTDSGLKGYIQSDAYDEAVLAEAIRQFPIENVNIRYKAEEAPDEDWNHEWEKHGFQPIAIDDECIIYDAKDPQAIDAHDKCKYPILIDARQAFGTGTHDTTQMILSTLRSMPLNGKSVLDCGCGTGILCIAASLFGARDVTAYDIDDWSVSNAMHNAEINGIGNLTVLHGTSDVLDDVNREFDIVLANINRNILIADMHNFCKKMKVDATLILSGFYTSDIPVLKQEAAKCGLTATTSKSSNDWACLILKKTGALPHPTDAAE